MKIPSDSNKVSTQSSTPIKNFSKSILRFIKQNNQCDLVRTGQRVILGTYCFHAMYESSFKNKPFDYMKIVQVATAAWTVPILMNNYAKFDAAIEKNAPGEVRMIFSALKIALVFAAMHYMKII